MKFTEEQYREIIRTYENNYGYDNKATAVIRVVDNFNDSLSYNEAFALANPVTREWAHERFVEEEKRYAWTLKKVDKNGIKMHLYKDYFGRIYPFFSVTNVNIDDNEKLTETEIREWGYNPEIFDKEEVE